MLLHQSLGLAGFNDLTVAKARHALYECCNSVTWSSQVAAARPFIDHDSLYLCADDELFALSETDIDIISEGHPRLGVRPDSAHSSAELCALSVPPESAGPLSVAIAEYEAYFCHRFVMYTRGATVESIVESIADRLHHDADTERKVLRNEIAKINRCRLERMLGPVGGYDNWE